CAKKTDYNTFDDSQYIESNQQYAYLNNSLNTQSSVVINANLIGTTIDTLSNDSLKIRLNTTKPSSTEVSGSIAVDNSLIGAYNTANNTNYVELPASSYALSNNSNLSIPKDSLVSSNAAILKINKTGLTLGTSYVLPIKISNVTGASASNNENTVYVVVNIPAANTASTAKANGYVQVMYVEVNYVNPLNAGSYYLTNSKIPYFDIVNLFAANIGFDNTLQKVVVTFNQNVTAILNNRAKYIVPLQKKGIKVCLSLLGDHQGVGFSNFTSYKAIDDFAQQVKSIVDQYQLDGIDLDDEYATYGINGQPRVNDSSLVLLVKRFREVMPNKIINYYYYSDAISIPRYSQWKGLTVGQYINYTYQGLYGVYSAPNVAGFTDKKRIGPFSVNVAVNQSATTLATRASTAKTAGYGVFMWYNLQSTVRDTWFGSVSNVFYGERVSHNGEIFNKDW
ncbi:MAG: hypothetical protein DI598_19560, partial [Pseudopedobacter saltans]